MLNRIIRFSVENKLVIGIFMVLWVAFGIYELTRLPIDAVPDITNNQVQIITTAPSLGTEDVERLITFPIEQATANIPGLKESRSMSRFGLSLVSIVFDDDSDIYWARQQVTERLSQVEMPETAGKPELAPVTTGLGEIYQYVVKPKKGFEDKYSLSDLRTTQDWLIRRQLLGTPGVADVSTFGGELKQYEVAVEPSGLKAMGLTITDVLTALSRNNQNTGGAYIEKGPTVLYIRSLGLAGSIDDINHIVVANRGGVPVLVQHVAQVRFAPAIRYGALTMAGYGEVAGGIVMMLKGGNSSDVVGNVKAKIAEISKTLPEGLEIEPFLDRTKMVNNAIGTVERNLLEGAVIVVIVLVLFLGNLRAGLIVASVIPLSMLFAVAMMNLFGVSGNLMSLGALDFGLIVDGAVIIVEAILHHLHAPGGYRGATRLTQQEMDREVSGSASRMMNAAVFGQIIILIVYLPILSLSGIEGKMFKPMAQTVAFAILGAFVLSLTYVPTVSALLISKKISHAPNWSDRLMARIERAYGRALAWTLRFKVALVAGAFALFGVAVLLFSRMGGEFIPQLEEGDFATETRLLVGTNLTTTINAINRISDRLQKDYSEVEKIVSRIGSAEIPTDPMPIEGGDMIIVLKDKSEWTHAKSFPELATKMAATAQEVVPGVTTGFQYPVQMRFNELMTGAKQDVVCKIFGEDLDKLAAYANQLGHIARGVSGTADWYVEELAGMPQIVIDFNRAEIAKYGLNVDDLNKTINAAFAGAAAGQVYEGEKRFDLVVRVGAEGRKRIADVQNLLVSTPGGVQIPLSQVAAVREIEGPNQIQRENTRRRIIVGFNVRGRDVQSIVEELQRKVDAGIKFESGYAITYGGAFENLQQAKARLGIAVPVALLLIFMMLYFTFSSVKDGALIYTAIPLSAIGGVFALALRDMPFSISAGVGFIALFGVAVLNGIVLVSEFNRIRKEGTITDMLQLVMTGTRNRLRPVLMTAAVASLGFLPMAISNGAGAEVQRPLATVVIGGLVTATLLTLFVLPALYLLFNPKNTLHAGPRGATTVIVVLLLVTQAARAQQPRQVTLDEAIQKALAHNRTLQSGRLGEQAADKLRRSAFDIPKTAISADYGNFNSPNNDTRIGISQSIAFPTVYANQRKAREADYLAARAQTRLAEQEVRTGVRRLFFEYAILKEREKLLTHADSIFTGFESKSNLRFERGASNVLEKTAASSQKQQIANQLNLVRHDLDILVERFNFWLQDSLTYVPQRVSSRMPAYALPDTTAVIADLPQIELNSRLTQSAYFRYRTEKGRMLPELSAAYNNQSLRGTQLLDGREINLTGKDRFGYLGLGLNFPLFFKAQTAQIAAARLDWLRARNEAELAEYRLRSDWKTASGEVRKFTENLRYYEQQGLPNAETILAAADRQFAAGEIDYLQWVILARQAIAIKSEYVNALASYNEAVIQLLHLTNH
ncbi:CusA/CzcA family heavy metal efflux RND transporter [Dyadobacter fermentans]|uniref:Heavy metal efflux pump, CzcA family n=1 Tax=Dyadobacter fermentans (strain ATCC 700827 / DSM 18053 / CIP 107007 / KCTC 52180 / NS114) TaxID=471854 RepID=C6W407_DYAFD|nr:CusA/CzcA family heavy metal efflux RND transporter [Dyadobacter fermentans]ACT92244.1 heavy metal efflux pump, CzcA family [Dyadobacter fermentans DSM 18053]